MSFQAWLAFIAVWVAVSIQLGPMAFRQDHEESYRQKPERAKGLEGFWRFNRLAECPNALNCMASAATHGFRRGLWSVAGVCLAACLYMALAVSGVAAALAAYPQVFEIIRWGGAAYLAWIGVSLLRSRGEAGEAAEAPAFSPIAAIRRAAMISLGNPKAIFVWLAVFTQFIDPGAPLAPQLALLGPSALGVTIVAYTA